MPAEGPALRPRPRRPRPPPLPLDGLRGGVRPRAPGPRDRHLRPGRELRLRPRRGEARPDRRRPGRLRAGRAVGRAARRRVDGARAAGPPRRATSRGPPSTPSGASTSTGATSRRTSSSPSPAALRRRTEEAGAVLDALLALDPLSPFAPLREGLADGGEQRPARVRRLESANEMPQETFLELATWYHGLGRLDRGRSRCWSSPPPTAEVLYWLARAEGRAGRPPGAAALLQKADAASPERVFPFRPESAEVLAWAASKSASWRPRYYLALVQWGAGNVDEARRLFEASGETPDYAPFYAARSLAFEERLARALDGRPRAGGPPRPGAVALRPDAGRPAAAPGRSAAKGLETARRLRRAVPRATTSSACCTRRRFSRTGATGEARVAARPPERHPLRGLDRGPAALPRGPPHARRRGAEEGRRRGARGARWTRRDSGPRTSAPASPTPRTSTSASRTSSPRRASRGSGRTRRGRARSSQRVTAFAGRGPSGTGTLVHALALKQTGREAEGRKLLADWSAREPGNAVAAWAVRAYAGGVLPLPDGAGEERASSPPGSPARAARPRHRERRRPPASLVLAGGWCRAGPLRAWCVAGERQKDPTLGFPLTARCQEV